MKWEYDEPGWEREHQVAVPPLIVVGNADGVWAWEPGAVNLRLDHFSVHGTCPLLLLKIKNAQISKSELFLRHLNP